MEGVRAQVIANARKFIEWLARENDFKVSKENRTTGVPTPAHIGRFNVDSIFLVLIVIVFVAIQKKNTL